MIRTYEFDVRVPDYLSDEKDEAFIDGVVALARAYGLTVESASAGFDMVKNLADAS